MCKETSQIRGLKVLTENISELNYHRFSTEELNYFYLLLLLTTNKKFVGGHICYVCQGGTALIDEREDNAG